MELFTKLVDYIQPLTISANYFILFVSHGYEYASDKTKQNPKPWCVVIYFTKN